MKKSIVVAFLALLASCTTEQKPQFVTVDGNAFVDGLGREVVFNGINHVHKVPSDNYMNPNDSSIFQTYRQSGFNFIRFGIYWNQLEPEPGQIDQQYLAQLDKRVRWARESGLMMMLDLHQDLYIEAAPAWAVLNAGEAHVTGDVWSDSYMISPAVQVAFDSFWANLPASDSLGIQDHYLEVLRVLAQRYRDEPTVVGIDIMNEPFMGSAALEIMPRMLHGYARATGSGESMESLVQRWSSAQSRLDILRTLNNRKLYAEVIRDIVPVVDQFEQGALSDFYQRSRDVIRSTGSRQILFLEHNYFCNMGVVSTFRIPVDSLGVRDAQCAYAPHGYDLVTDTGGDNDPATERVDFIFGSILESARARELPVVLGEWGAFYGGDYDYTAPARHIVEWVESAKAGQAYWCYWPGVDQENYYRRILSRSYPGAVNGRIEGYRNDFDKSTFEMQWTESTGSEAKTIIYVQDPTQCEVVELEPRSEYRIAGNYLAIDPLASADLTRKLTLRTAR